MLRLLLLFIVCSSFQAADWSAPKYQAARTADKSEWQTQEEKDVFFYVNLARMFPKEFAEKYVKEHIQTSAYHRSLYQTLYKTPAMKPFQPSKELYTFAECFAKEAGKKGYVGHKRTKCADGSFAECCSYGADDPLDVVMNLLVDDKTPSLGHRKILLDAGYTKMGVSTQPHKTYSTNTVLDIYK